MTEAHFNRRLTQLREEIASDEFTTPGYFQNRLAPRWEHEIPVEVHECLLTDDEAAKLIAEVRRGISIVSPDAA